MKKSKKSIFFILFITFCTSLLSAQLDKKLYDKGEEIYSQACSSCHGKDGETNSQMRLLVKPRKLSLTILTREQSFKIIKNGAHHFGAHSDLMPAFKYVYTDKQIESVAYYITKKFNLHREKRVADALGDTPNDFKEDNSKMLETGEKIFKKKCSLCHGESGNGESEYVELSKSSSRFIYPYNLTRTLLSQEQIFLYAKYGGHYWGTDKDDMASWKKKYNDFKLMSVAKYVNEKIKRIKE